MDERRRGYPVRLLFTLLGGAALFYILHDYGVDTLRHEIRLVGWRSSLLALTFIPTLTCYALAWCLVTEWESPAFFRKGALFFRMSASSIAWNNLTPFLRVGGEPAKVFMLSPWVGRRLAIKSVILYNLVHLMGTIGAIVLASLMIPFLFSVKPEVRLGCFLVASICIVLFLLLSYSPVWGKALLRGKKSGRLRRILLWLHWAFRETAMFHQKHRTRLYGGIVFEIAARFVEGATFYLAFYLMDRPISLLTSMFLDIGRTLVDNLFFFIPYQVGSREAGVLILMRDIFGIVPDGYVTAVLMCRFVEVAWIVIGYFLWVRNRTRRMPHRFR